jgi:hypothetical protein
MIFCLNLRSTQTAARNNKRIFKPKTLKSQTEAGLKMALENYK